jgi:hypothetical protein
MGAFPRQVADRLRGQVFNNWQQFREAFWRAVSDTPELNAAFSPQNQARIADGLAPYAPQAMHQGGISKFMLDHTETIAIGREATLYNMDEIMVVSPKVHNILSH